MKTRNKDNESYLSPAPIRVKDRKLNFLKGRLKQNRKYYPLFTYGSKFSLEFFAKFYRIHGDMAYVSRAQTYNGYIGSFEYDSKSKEVSETPFAVYRDTDIKSGSPLKGKLIYVDKLRLTYIHYKLTHKRATECYSYFGFYPDISSCDVSYVCPVENKIKTTRALMICKTNHSFKNLYESVFDVPDSGHFLKDYVNKKT